MRTISITDNEAELIIEALTALINRYSDMAEDCYKEGKEEIAFLFENDYYKAANLIKKFHVEHKEE